jgi:simple sugar transport system ATP-binding protein
MNSPLLKLTNVNKSFGPIDVLHDISLEVDAGEVLCLLGDNGAGKSTLIKILSGVHKVTSGTVEMSGKVVDFNSPRDALDHGIATVHQFGGTFPLMSIGRSFFVGEEPIKGWGPFKSLDRKRANEIAVNAVRGLGITRIDDGDRLVGGLSGGERQALAIARAVHFGASVLILDEPTAALGVKEAAHVLRIVLQAAPEGHRSHIHHPQRHPRADCRGPLCRPHQRRQGGRFSQGREDPRGDHRPDGWRRAHGRA